VEFDKSGCTIYERRSIFLLRGSSFPPSTHCGILQPKKWLISYKIHRQKGSSLVEEFLDQKAALLVEESSDQKGS
jgi:hypothetical protein